MSTNSSASPGTHRTKLWRVLLVIGLILIVGVVVWFGTFLKNGLDAKRFEVAATANARGIGLMEQFDYLSAVVEFDKAVEAAPYWTPAKINLGIALLNTTTPENLQRAIDLFEGVIRQDPDNPHAHYSLGIILIYLNRITEAAPHFEAVTRIDPTDAHGWYQRGVTYPDKDDAPQAKEFFRKALELNPYLNAARYALALHGHERDPQKTDAMMQEKIALVDANWESEYQLVYSEMGRYAEVIGKRPVVKNLLGPLPMFEKWGNFQVTLSEGTKWATDVDLRADPQSELRQAIRARFGGTVVVFDYDQDKRLDLLLLSAVMRNGKLTDLLLHNDGDGKFSDTTVSLGLGTGASFGTAVADFDNDGWPDVVLTGPYGVRLFRNELGQKFNDKSTESGTEKLTGVYLGVSWLDLDQDGDLDLLLAKYADTPAEALASLKTPGKNGGVQIMLNVGEALPQATPGLTCKFRLADKLSPLTSTLGPVTAFVGSDLDADRDVDVVTLVDGQSPIVTVNDRLLRFSKGQPITAQTGAWNGGLVLRANDDEQSDLFLLRTGNKPLVLLSASDAPINTLTNRFSEGTTDSPPLIQAVTTDLDHDGHADIVGLSEDRKPIVLQGDGQGKLLNRAVPFGPVADQLPNLIGFAVADFDNDCFQDLLTWSSDSGLTVFRSLGNPNRAVKIELTGKRDKGANLRTNTDGIGATVGVLTGRVQMSQENTTLSAGLGLSRQPITLGIGKAATADVVRVRWPDGVPQAELNVPTCEFTRILENNRKGTSCPILHTWDGQRFRYITDFLGGGALGECGPDGSVRPPRPEESVKIEPGQLLAKNGKFTLKISEPMDEVLYLDHVRLDVFDHPTQSDIHPDERFSTGGPAVTQKPQQFTQRFHATTAKDHMGRDVTDTLKSRDTKTVDGFKHRHWLGYAEDHFVELDFNAQSIGTTAKPPVMVLAGWIDYPYPESIFAATQADVPMVSPVLEQLGADGKWTAVAELGFPAGLPKVMTRELPELVGKPIGKLRIRTNLQIYWDEIYIAVPEIVTSPSSLGVAKANLAHRGFMQEVMPNGKPPIEYNNDRTEPVSATKWHGKLTRTGDVTALLTEVDDRFVLAGPGDEITIEFDAAKLPDLKPGHVRSFVLRTNGYCKDTAPFTKTGGYVGPLPYRNMTSYPDGAFDRTKARNLQDAYDREWNTRSAGQ